jgi:hypothetical protein
MPDLIPIMRPRADGQQFVMYGDSCSGVADALHESTFASVNAVLQRLATPPEFICFPGDEIMGLTTNPDELRRQWAHWFTHEMAWLDRDMIPMFHTTGNHTTYDTMSEDVFREVMAHLPDNGPVGQKGLSYWVRRGDVLLVFVHTLWSGLGGEGHVETVWLAETLHQHADAKHKLVFGHHPVWTVNGFFADYQRNIERKNGALFWDILVAHGVSAYICSHILAFDVQVHAGVLQICTAGAGTAHRMPDGVEYLHAIQAALDDEGLRYQVLDTQGQVREWLAWDWDIPSRDTWATFTPSEAQVLHETCLQAVDTSHLIIWDITGQVDRDDFSPTTLLSTRGRDGALPAIWLGVSGRDHHVMLSLSPRANRSPHSWHGPSLDAHKPFRIQFAIHSGMNAGGLLWRWDDGDTWSTLTGSSPWGVEKLLWSHDWVIGEGISVRWHHQAFELGDYV